MTSEKVALPDKQPTIRVVAMPADTNPGGSIFGGWIMSQVDIAAGIAAIERARGRVATVAVNSFEFHQPVFVGDLISCYTEVIKVGQTSITVKVEVFAQRNVESRNIERVGNSENEENAREIETIKVTEAELTFVALDENRKPRNIPAKLEHETV